MTCHPPNDAFLSLNHNKLIYFPLLSLWNVKILFQIWCWLSSLSMNGLAIQGLDLYIPWIKGIIYPATWNFFFSLSSSNSYTVVYTTVLYYMQLHCILTYKNVFFIFTKEDISSKKWSFFKSLKFLSWPYFFDIGNPST